MKKCGCIVLIIMLIGVVACSKDNTTNESLYTPTTTDVTANATLAELQQGRSLYIAKCESCHKLYSPDDFSVTRWKSILSQMTPKTNMSDSEVTLVTKYVCRGNQ